LEINEKISDTAYKVLAKNTFLIGLGAFGSKAISFIMLPFFTRALSRSEYGQISIFITTISLLIPLVTMDIVEAVFRFTIAEESVKRKQEILTSSLLLVMGGTLIFIIFKPWLIHLEIFSRFFWFFIVTFVLSSVFSILKTFVRAEKRIILYASSDIVYTALFASLGIFLVFILKKGIYGYFIAMIGAAFFANIYLFYAGQLYRKMSFRYISISQLINMLRYSLPIVPTAISWWVINVSDRYLLTFFLGYSSTGLYAVSCKFMAILNVLKGIFMQAWQISAIDEYNKKAKGEFYSKIFLALYTLMMLAVFLFAIFLKQIVYIMTSPEFFQAWEYVPILLLGAVFSAFSSFFGVGYIASKKTGGAFRTSVMGAVINVVINLFLIPKIGIQAAALSTFLAYLCVWIVRTYDTKKYLNIKLDWFKLIQGLFFAAIALGANFLSNFTLTIIVQILGLFFFIVLFKQEIQMLIKFTLKNTLKRFLQIK